MSRQRTQLLCRISTLASISSVFYFSKCCCFDDTPMFPKPPPSIPKFTTPKNKNPTNNLQTTKKWNFYEGPIEKDEAETLKLFKCNDQPLADEIGKFLGVPMNQMTLSKFADGETSIQIHDGVRGHQVYLICSTTNIDRIMELLLSISAMRRASAKNITAIIPYYGYGRQDRVTYNKRESIAAADIARMLEVVGVDHVVTVNLHSPQIEGFFKPQIPVDNLCALPIGAMFFSEMHLENPIIVSPHTSQVPGVVQFHGSLIKYRNDDDLHIPIAVAVKQNLLGLRKPGELIGDVKNRDCIVVDTLVDTGRTLCEVAHLLKKNGARKVYAFSVHGRMTAEGVNRILNSKDLDMLVITNTIYQSLPENNNNKIVVLNIAPMIAQVINSLHSKKSIGDVCKVG